jgi:Ca2+-transporting ATPase
LFISFVSAVLLRDTPFKAVQLLWVNMIMDSFGALALATGKPLHSLLDRKPTKREMPIISGPMIRTIASQAILQIILIGMILIFPGDLPAYSQYHYTFLFNVFVFCQMFNLLNARSTEPNDPVMRGLMDSPLFLLIMIGIAGGQFFLVEIAGAFFSCTPLYLHEWLLSIGLASLSLPAGYLFRHWAAAVTYRTPGAEFVRSADDQPLLTS